MIIGYCVAGVDVGAELADGDDSGAFVGFSAKGRSPPDRVCAVRTGSQAGHYSQGNIPWRQKTLPT